MNSMNLSPKKKITSPSKPPKLTERNTRQTSSSPQPTKSKYINTRLVAQLYKDLIIEYPLKNKTQVFCFAVQYFLEKVSKKKRDSWLKTNTSYQNPTYTSARVLNNLYRDLIVLYPLTNKTHLIASAIKYFLEEVSKNKRDKWLQVNGVMDKY